MGERGKERLSELLNTILKEEMLAFQPLKGSQYIHLGLNIGMQAINISALHLSILLVVTVTWWCRVLPGMVQGPSSGGTLVLVLVQAPTYREIYNLFYK